MKTFAKNNYYIQLSLLIIGLALALLDALIFHKGFVFLSYFIVGIPQLISFLIKAFQQTEKSLRYIVYGFFIIPVWISWLVILGIHQNNDTVNFFGYILIASVFYSPLLAIIYVYDNYKTYKSLK